MNEAQIKAVIQPCYAFLGGAKPFLGGTFSDD
jgi:hypothetical protein